MAMRVSGLISGMDTESIVQELVAVKQMKVDDTKKAQTKLSWKQDAWKSLNTQIRSFHEGALSDLRFESSYIKKTTKVSNPNAVSVITGEGAMNSVQSLKVEQLATTGYLTGGQLGDGKQNYTASTTLGKLGLDDSLNGTIKVQVGDSVKEIEVSANTKISELVSSLRDAGVSASFDATNQRMYIAAKSSGEASDFSIVAGDIGGLQAMQKLGISYLDDSVKDYYSDIVNGDWDAEIQKRYDAAVTDDMTDDEKTALLDSITAEVNGEKTQFENLLNNVDGAVTAANKTKGEKAIISLNGVEYTSERNTFEINGLTLTVNATTGENETITVTTEDDTDGIYDMIKNFFKEYNTLINQMDKLYNADSAKDYEPLTDEEKDSMTDSAIEEWETKIKDALLRKDSTLGTVSSAMKEIMLSGVEVNGKRMYLSNFGIETLGYFTAAENEKNAYHINGDPDDTNTSGNTDKLKSMIASDPDTVVSFFTSLSKTLYSKISDLMKKTDYSSSFTVYEDVRMKEEYNDYTTKIKDLEDKLNDYEDNWYSKFSAMETALAKLQSSSSAVTSLLGGS